MKVESEQFNLIIIALFHNLMLWSACVNAKRFLAALYKPVMTVLLKTTVHL